ncbi:hypothetical protein ACU5AX_20515 [Sphingomonas sp. XXL09]|uniref:hypothetical protein n=1 Tax=Sphingomonas sp. XXL09 TaxID=3457787 RepID=UPI00406BA268
MRILTEEEVSFVAGGDGTDDGGDIVVIGTYAVGGGYASGGSYDSSGSTSPMSGPQDRGPAGPGRTHTTPHGYKYTVSNFLTSEQTAVLDDIVEYGMTHGKQGSINAVAALAFAESSFKPNAGSGTEHVGLGQYSTEEWKARGETGDISSPQDQIKALFHDYDYYMDRYRSVTSTNEYGINDAHVSMLEYFEIKHHGGSNETNWNKVDPNSGDPKDHSDDITYRQEIANANSYLGWRLM